MAHDPNHASHALAVAEPTNGQVSKTVTGPVVLAGEGDAAPPGLSSAPTVAGLWQALKRRWRLAVPLAIGAGVLAVAAVFIFMPPRYVVEYRANVLATMDAGLFEQNAHVEFALFKEYQKALVRSPLILAAALNERTSSGREVRDLPIVRAQGADILDWMERSLKVDFKVAPEVMSVWLSGDDPDGLADLLNAIGTAFVKENAEKEAARRKERIDGYRENLKAKEQELASLRTKFAAKFKPEEAKQRLGNERQLAQLQRKLDASNLLLQTLQVRQGENDLEVADLKAKLKLVDTQQVTPDALDEYLRGDTKFQAIAKSLEDIDLKIADYPLKFPKRTADDLVEKEEANRKVVIEQLERLRMQSVPRYRAKAKADLVDKLEVAEKRHTFVELQIKARAEEADTLNRQIAALDPASLSEPPDIQKLRDEVTRTQKAIENIGQKVVELSIERGNSRVSTQLRAIAPTERDYSRQTKLAGASGFSAFALMLFGVAFWEFRTRRISMTDEVSRGLGLTVVGTLPAVPVQARGATAAAKDQAAQAQLQEAVDGVRTMLLHASRNEALRVIMVTSACGGEGKTSVASQLAASLARAWRKTLLIDGDLRSPAAHKVFDLPREPGLSEVLRGEVSVEDAIRASSVGRLWVLPAGHFDSQAGEALVQDNVATLFEQLRSQYDYVIVDSSPVLPVPDALELGQHVDGVLFSILRDVSRAPEVYAAHQRLAPLGSRTLGAVVIGMESDLNSRASRYAAS